MAPAASLARLRKWMLDRVARKEVSVVPAAREAGISTSRFYELRARYHAYGEAGLLPKPRPPRPERQLSAPLTDQIIAYAIDHPTVGPRTIETALSLHRFGGCLPDTRSTQAVDGCGARPLVSADRATLQ